jgi:ribonuclease PH
MGFRIGDFKQQIDPNVIPPKGGRGDGRAPDQLRKVTITRGFTKVICTASVEDRVPPFLKGKGEGWITSEYGMLPRATTTRTQRESTKGMPSGRTQEIQRLIGRSLRAVVDMKALGERTLWIDCDVIQADGGTRTASITGAFVAVVDALRHMKQQGQVNELPILDYVAATSVGKVRGKLLLDLAYEEDSQADVDMNIIKTGSGKFVEIQGTAEQTPFDEDEMQKLMGLAGKGIQELVKLQKNALGDFPLKTK